jgi:hypothetical protein
MQRPVSLGGSAAVGAAEKMTRAIRARPAEPWATTLLTWQPRERGEQAAECSRATYFVQPWGLEVLATIELHDKGGTYRLQIGSYGSVRDAKAACERDAQRRLRREAEPERVDIRIAQPRRR